MAKQRRSGPSRRQLLQTALSSGALLTVGAVFRPLSARAADRPSLTHGLQSGHMSADSGIVWARADRPSRLIVEDSTTDSFKDVIARSFVDALPEKDFAPSCCWRACTPEPIPI